jgi:hypothetical protein
LNWNIRLYVRTSSKVCTKRPLHSQAWQNTSRIMLNKTWVGKSLDTPKYDTDRAYESQRWTTLSWPHQQSSPINLRKTYTEDVTWCESTSVHRLRLQYWNLKINFTNYLSLFGENWIDTIQMLTQSFRSSLTFVSVGQRWSWVESWEASFVSFRKASQAVRLRWGPSWGSGQCKVCSCAAAFEPEATYNKLTSQFRQAHMLLICRGKEDYMLQFSNSSTSEHRRLSSKM